MYYIYILSNHSNSTLYIGVSGNLEGRLYQHKNKFVDSFSSRYNLYKLVYYEETKFVEDAIAREKQLKKWSRKKKEALIESINKDWRDLSNDWV